MVETHYHQEDTSSASLAVILVALLIVVAFAVFGLRYLAASGSVAPTDNSSRLNIDLDTPTPVVPDTTPAQ